MNPLLLAPLFTEVIDRVFPDDESRANAKKALAEIDQDALDSFRRFVVEYEGRGDQVAPTLQFYRGSVRPTLTYALAGLFGWGFANPGAIDANTMQMLFQLNLLSLGFWYGERALKNLGLNFGDRHGQKTD